MENHVRSISGKDKGIVVKLAFYHLFIIVNFDGSIVLYKIVVALTSMYKIKLGILNISSKKSPENEGLKFRKLIEVGEMIR